MKLYATVRASHAEILRIASRYGVLDVRLFGSVARGQADEHSDVDLLVTMEEAQPAGSRRLPVRSPSPAWRTRRRGHRT